MRGNADVDFEIRAEDMVALKAVALIEDYGEASDFQLYGDNTTASRASIVTRLTPAI